MTTLIDLDRRVDETEIDREIDEAEIGWLLTKRGAAVKAMDADYLVSRHAPGSTGFDITPARHGRDHAVTDAAALRDWFRTFEDSLDYSILDLSIVVGDDVAFAHSLDHFTATPFGARRAQVWLHVTTGLRRIGGCWLITHEHRSIASPPQ
ncbi:YybH family protein [Leifsonia sp. Leaf264]|uniref:YybH family protein n=1 Tax=Leifsonia sp. Leaf264 TaxID=1736314 RepID=UPI000AA33EEF|nr:nuclear transport factor 2 family protein [Leifsonia sp. Leaf264]